MSAIPKSSDALLTPESWALAAEIMNGESKKRVSATSAAQAAGVSIKVLRDWIARSRERRPRDEPWVWEIAGEWDVRGRMQAEVLKDVHWDMALNGVREVTDRDGVVTTKVKQDPKTVLAALRARDPDYVATPKVAVSINNVKLKELNGDSVRERLLALTRIANAGGIDEKLPVVIDHA